MKEGSQNSEVRIQNLHPIMLTPESCFATRNAAFWMPRSEGRVLNATFRMLDSEFWILNSDG
jgi:hypothetical protein